MFHAFTALQVSQDISVRDEQNDSMTLESIAEYRAQATAKVSSALKPADTTRFVASDVSEQRPACATRTQAVTGSLHQAFRPFTVNRQH